MWKKTNSVNFHREKRSWVNFSRLLTAPPPAPCDRQSDRAPPRLPPPAGQIGHPVCHRRWEHDVSLAHPGDDATGREARRLPHISPAVSTPCSFSLLTGGAPSVKQQEKGQLHRKNTGRGCPSRTRRGARGSEQGGASQLCRAALRT